MKTKANVMRTKYKGESRAIIGIFTIAKIPFFCQFSLTDILQLISPFLVFVANLTLPSRGPRRVNQEKCNSLAEKRHNLRSQWFIVISSHITRLFVNRRLFTIFHKNFSSHS